MLSSSRAPGSRSLTSVVISRWSPAPSNASSRLPAPASPCASAVAGSRPPSSRCAALRDAAAGRAAEVFRSPSARCTTTPAAARRARAAARAAGPAWNACTSSTWCIRRSRSRSSRCTTRCASTPGGNSSRGPSAATSFPTARNHPIGLQMRGSKAVRLPGRTGPAAWPPGSRGPGGPARGDVSGVARASREMARTAWLRCRRRRDSTARGSLLAAHHRARPIDHRRNDHASPAPRTSRAQSTSRGHAAGWPAASAEAIRCATPARSTLLSISVDAGIRRTAPKRATPDPERRARWSAHVRVISTAVLSGRSAVAVTASPSPARSRCTRPEGNTTVAGSVTWNSAAGNSSRVAPAGAMRTRGSPPSAERSCAGRGSPPPAHRSISTTRPRSRSARMVPAVPMIRVAWARPA